MNDPGPSPETFRKLRQMMPQLKAQATGKRVLHRNGTTKTPCALCGKHYGSAFKSNTKPYCPACTKELKDGFAALVTIDNSRPVLFFKHDNMPKEWAGAVKMFLPEQIDLIKQRYEEQQKANDANTD